MTLLWRYFSCNSSFLSVDVDIYTLLLRIFDSFLIAYKWLCTTALSGCLLKYRKHLNWQTYTKIPRGSSTTYRKRHFVVMRTYAFRRKCKECGRVLSCLQTSTTPQNRSIRSLGHLCSLRNRQINISHDWFCRLPQRLWYSHTNDPRRRECKAETIA